MQGQSMAIALPARDYTVAAVSSRPTQGPQFTAGGRLNGPAGRTVAVARPTQVAYKEPMQVSRRVVLRSLGLLMLCLLALVWWYDPARSVDRVVRPSRRPAKAATERTVPDAGGSRVRPRVARRHRHRNRRPTTAGIALLGSGLPPVPKEPVRRIRSRPPDGAAPHPSTSPGNRLAGETSPYLLMHARQSGRLVSVVCGSLCAGTQGEQAGLSVDRLFELPLVSRHGAGDVSRRGRRRAAERAFRLHQSRS